MIYFFIGTEAELIKLFPIVLECKKREVEYKIISSGQNNLLDDNRIISETKCCNIDLRLSNENDIKKTAVGLLTWWLKTFLTTNEVLKEFINKTKSERNYMIVHGDTVSTLMGSLIGKRFKMRVCHIEAGLRSHNLLNPFPEEIDRLLTSLNTDIHFAPNNLATQNLKNVNGIVVNTSQNTLLDSLNFSKKTKVLNKDVENILNDNYFVFVMHRQENISNKKYFTCCINEILKVSNNIKCIFILHKITKQALINYNLYDSIIANDNIVVLDRVDYFDFVKLLAKSKFVITDGGSNQEELYYLNRPTLIMRKVTERNEGLGTNATLFSGDFNQINGFVNENINSNKKFNTFDGISPSKIIIDTLIKQNL